jgi:hypothetical protein
MNVVPCSQDIVPEQEGKTLCLESLQFRIAVHSSRWHTDAGRRAVESWLERHEIVVDEVCEHKPPALVYVDDRTVRFRGDWDQAMTEIRDFRR